MQRIQPSFALLVTPKMAQADLSTRTAKFFLLCISVVKSAPSFFSEILKMSMSLPGIERAHKNLNLF